MRPKTYRSIMSLNRAFSWVLLIAASSMMATGYLSTRFLLDRMFIMAIHTNLGYFFAVIFVVHGAISVLVLRFPWMNTLNYVRKGRAGRMTWLRLLQRASAWMIFVLGAVLVISGLAWNNFGLWRGLPYNPHVRFDIMMAAAVVVHVAVGSIIALERHRITLPGSSVILIIAGLLILSMVFYIDGSVRAGETKGQSVNGQVFLNETKPHRQGLVTIGVTVGMETFEFDPEEVETIRPDIFKPGYFSVFDVLVHISGKGLAELDYHFEESMNTYVIDSLNGDRFWWYFIFYDGGWREVNYFRMDHYPWKDGTTLDFYPVTPERLERTYDVFRREVARREENGGRIVIPKVTIYGNTFRAEFTDVEVVPHDLRSDMFQDDVVTAIDVILSLGDGEELTYELMWYESIGRARVVKDYWIQGINGDVGRDRCGFVYEAGDEDIGGQGNHIHLPSDIRVLNSPEYVLLFWICI